LDLLILPNKCYLECLARPVLLQAVVEAEDIITFEVLEDIQATI